MIHVFVIAATPTMQAGLHAMLTSTEIRVVGESWVPDASTEDLPDLKVIVVADEVLLEDVRHTITNNASTALVALTNNNEQTLSLLHPLNLRGWGILPLNAPASQLQATVLAAAQGSVVLPTPLATRLYERCTFAETVQLEALDESLTSREREVLELLSQGLPNKLVARRLQISEHTVKFHVSSISTKLGASSRTDAVQRGLRKGLITL